MYGKGDIFVMIQERLLKKYDMLLFSVERASFPFKYKLYFAEKDSLLESVPVIHCFVIRNKKEFMSLEIGGIYDIVANGIYVNEITFRELYHLSEDGYMYLLDSRDAVFFDEREKKHIGYSDADYNPADYYYSLRTAKTLYHYTPETKNNLLYILLKCGQYASCVLVPITLFVLYIFVCAKLAGNNRFAPFVLPLSATATIPFMFFIMILLHSLTDSLILNMPSVKYIVLKKYFLIWAGMKKDVTLNDISTKKFKIFGIVCSSIFVLGLLINILFK